MTFDTKQIQLAEDAREAANQLEEIRAQFREQGVCARGVGIS